MTEFGDFWDSHDELKDFFGTRTGFCVWMGKNEDRLPMGYVLDDILDLRVAQLEKGI